MRQGAGDDEKYNNLIMHENIRVVPNILINI